MKLKLVDFETAKDLKELGFDWKCVYTVYRSIDRPDTDTFNAHQLQRVDWNNQLNNANIKSWVAAPEQALVVKWFRDIHNIHIEVWFSKPRHLKILKVDIKNPWGVGWEKQESNKTMLEDISYHDTFETAELEGIKKAIEYLKEFKTSEPEL